MNKEKNKARLTIICAWCKKVLEFGDNFTFNFATGRISHGICKKCGRDMMKEYEKEKANG